MAGGDAAATLRRRLESDGGQAGHPIRGGVGLARPHRLGAGRSGGARRAQGRGPPLPSTLPVRAALGPRGVGRSGQGGPVRGRAGAALRRGGAAGRLGALLRLRGHRVHLGRAAAQRPHGRERLPARPRHGRVGVPGDAPGVRGPVRRGDDRPEAPHEPVAVLEAVRLLALRHGRRCRRRPRRAPGRAPRVRTRTSTVCSSNLPHVVPDRAAPLGDRRSRRGGSFFDGVPTGGDAYLLRAILHDWPDDDCIRIPSTRAARRWATRRRILIIERRPGRRPAEEAALSDLNMLIGPGGRERTRAEYASLLASAGLRLARGLAQCARAARVRGGAPQGRGGAALAHSSAVRRSASSSWMRCRLRPQRANVAATADGTSSSRSRAVQPGRGPDVAQPQRQRVLRAVGARTGDPSEVEQAVRPSAPRRTSRPAARRSVRRRGRRRRRCPRGRGPRPTSAPAPDGRSRSRARIGARKIGP